MRKISLLGACVLLMGAVGCGDVAHFKEPPAAFSEPETTFNLPPKQLYDAAKKVVTSPPLSLPIEQEKSGSFITGFKEYQGEWHIARHWQERTRYRVTVIPDFDNPTTKSRLRVDEETETRAADGQKWQRQADLARPERAQDLLKQIEQRVSAK